jgi:hypothetical protein
MMKSSALAPTRAAMMTQIRRSMIRLPSMWAARARFTANHKPSRYAEASSTP